MLTKLAAHSTKRKRAVNGSGRSASTRTCPSERALALSASPPRSGPSSNRVRPFLRSGGSVFRRHSKRHPGRWSVIAVKLEVTCDKCGAVGEGAAKIGLTLVPGSEVPVLTIVGGIALPEGWVVNRHIRKPTHLCPECK